MPTKDRKFTFPETMWAGTDQSLVLAMEYHDAMMAGMFDAAPSTQPKADAPYNFNLQGEVGVIKIKGSLVNNDSPYNQYRGVTSYSDIRRALIHAVNEPGVKAILLDIDSGGGAVSGVADVGNLISMIHSSLKSVYAYSDGTMASAAYWLGVSAGSVHVSQTAMTGSIGVIATHQEYSKAFKEAGIGVTVMRAGEYKALVNSMEPLSNVAKTQLQEQLNAAYGIFIGHVAESRGTTVALADKTMGQGREFFGAAAVDAGLADGVKNFDAMISMINAKLIDTSAQSGHHSLNHQRGSNMPGRQALTEQQIAAMAAGAGAAVTPDAAALAAAALAATAETEAAAAAAAAALALAAAAPVAVTQPQAGNDAIVAYLQSQIKDKDALILAGSVELSGVKAKLATVEATHSGLVKIAATSVSNMKIGMGLARVDFSAMTPDLLLAEHASTSEAFTKAFKVGGVAAVTPPADEKAAAKEPDHLHAARVAATRFPNTK